MDLLQDTLQHNHYEWTDQIVTILLVSNLTLVNGAVGQMSQESVSNDVIQNSVFTDLVSLLEKRKVFTVPPPCVVRPAVQSKSRN
uniref:Timeless n=1 Tax=Romanomermis culicivorax TaxID=13658 RepID=A0A915KV59_ROMCU